MYQLSYASYSISEADKLFEDLRSILKEARDFNVIHKITGVLYFADQYFFQCLEGRKEDLEFLVEKLKKDSRHKDFTLFECKPIDKLHFKDWSMKYVKRNSLIQDYMREQGFQLFQPKQLRLHQLDKLIGLLVDIED